MSTEIIQAHYEQLDQIAARFGNQAEAISNMLARITRAGKTLEQGDWEGRGVQSFTSEMNSVVYPGLQRTISAFEQAQSVTLQVSQMMQDAEEEAASPFRGGDPSAITSGNKAGKKADDGLQITKWAKVQNGELFLGGEGDTKTRTWKIPKFYQRFFGGRTEFTYTTGKIHPNDITQGQLSDCFLVTSLATIADQRPGLISKAIKDNGNGTYTVTFYDEDKKPVEITVEPSFPQGDPNRSFHAGVGDVVNGKEELWPRIIEKAYAKWQGNGDEARGYNILNQGGSTHNVLEALSGADSQSKDPTDYTIQQLSEMHKQGQAMTLSSLSGSGRYEYGDYTLVRWHAYWIDEVNVGDGTVTIRNPWGYDDSPGRKIIMKYDDLDENFRNITANSLKSNS